MQVDPRQVLAGDPVAVPAEADPVLGHLDTLAEVVPAVGLMHRPDASPVPTHPLAPCALAARTVVVCVAFAVFLFQPDSLIQACLYGRALGPLLLGGCGLRRALGLPLRLRGPCLSFPLHSLASAASCSSRLDSQARCACTILGR